MGAHFKFHNDEAFEFFGKLPDMKLTLLATYKDGVESLEPDAASFSKLPSLYTRAIKMMREDFKIQRQLEDKECPLGAPDKKPSMDDILDEALRRTRESTSISSRHRGLDRRRRMPHRIPHH